MTLTNPVNNQSQLTIYSTLTIMITSDHIVETSVTISDSAFQNYTHPDEHIHSSYITFNIKRFMKFAFSCVFFFCILFFMCMSFQSNEGFTSMVITFRVSVLSRVEKFKVMPPMSVRVITRTGYKISGNLIGSHMTKTLP